MTSIQIDINDGLSSSTAIKGPCRVATTANIALTGEQTIDGVAVVTDDRVLVKDQTTASENGIYVADTGPWRRAKDFNKTRDVKTGTMVNVFAGTVGAGQWQVSTADPITIGTTSIVFVQTVQPFAGLPIPPTASTIPVRNAGNTAYEAKSFAEVRDLLDTAPYVATLAALKALDTTKDTVAVLTDTLRAGIFVWRAGNLSTLVALDLGEGIWVKADAIATTAGAWVRLVDGPYNPLWFGCTIDGAASDTAFGRFLDVLIATGNAGRLPTGTITLASKVTKNVGAAALVLSGQGPDVSILLWTAADGGLDITTTNMPGFTQWARQVEIRDFSIKTTQASGGTALKHTINPTYGSSGSLPGHYSNLGIIGEDPNADYWDEGIVLIDCLDITVERCSIKGIDDDGLSPFLQAYGIRLLRCNDCHLINNHIYHVITGIKHESASPSFGDGTSMIDNRIVGVDNGIIGDQSVYNAWMGVYGNHINAYLLGISVSKLAYTPIRDNLIFKTNPSTATNWKGIALVDALAVVISGNQVAMPGTAGVTTNFGIHIDGGERNIITENSFHNTTSTFYGVYLTNTTTLNTISLNRADTTVDAILGSSGTEGAANFVFGNWPVAIYATFTSTDTTPSVKFEQGGMFRTANASATSITTFDDGYEGQTFDLNINDANTTLVNGATLALLGAQNTTPPSGSVLRFRKIGTVWTETYRSFEVDSLINGSYTKTAQSKQHSYNSANALVIGNRIENDNGTSPTAALGFQVTDSSGETRSAKAGLGLVRQAANGRGRFGVYVRTTNDTSDFTTSDFKSGWTFDAGIFNETFGASVASAAAIVPTGNTFHVTGTTTITSVTATNIGAGTIITIIFDGVLTFTNGSNLKLAGNFVTSALDTITLRYDGTNWYEMCRSVNV